MRTLLQYVLYTVRSAALLTVLYCTVLYCTVLYFRTPTSGTYKYTVHDYYTEYRVERS